MVPIVLARAGVVGVADADDGLRLVHVGRHVVVVVVVVVGIRIRAVQIADS